MRTRPLVIGALVLALAAGCGGDPSAAPSDPPSVSESVSESPSPAPPAWQSKFTARELRAYRNALAVWEDWKKESAPIWATGKDTPEAQRIIKRYWVLPQPMLSRLTAAEAVGAKTTGTEEILSSQLVAFAKGELTIRQCVSNSETVETVKGEAVRNLGHPFMRRIVLGQLRQDLANWGILAVQDPTTRWIRKCDA